MFVNIKKGEFITFVKLYEGKPEWQNWAECIFNDKVCYVPIQYLYKVNEKYFLNRDYDSKELKVSKGMLFRVDFFLNGFAYGKLFKTKEYGWVPQSVLEMYK